MSDIQISHVTVGYGSTSVLGDISLNVRGGSTTAVLGGSGSGKTTLLRVIAGFLRPTAGDVVVGGRTVAGPGIWVPPEKRGIGYVRQEGGLFPHLSVAGNIAFGLSWPRRRHRERVMELLELVELPAELADRRPDQLSGGQQQRVALARALAPGPDLVLLDEPFSSLDTALRASTREATSRALRAAGATAILVTHDQGEALSFADEVAILRGGAFRQVAPPRVIYGEPVDALVAAFLGDAVLVPGTAASGAVFCALGRLPVRGFVAHGDVEVMLRPEQIVLTEPGQGQVDAVVRSIAYFGHDAVVELDVEVNNPIDDASRGVRARVAGLQPPVPGQRVGLSVVGPVRVYPNSQPAS